MSGGKYVIIGIFALATAAGLCAVVYHRSRVSRPFALWGQKSVLLIADASQATALKLMPATDEERRQGTQPLMIDGQPWRIIERRDVSHAQGFVNIRRGLIDDGSYAWDQPPGDCQPQWQYALEFSGDGPQATLVFAFNCEQAALLKSPARVSIKPIAEDLRAFLEEQFERADADGEE